MNIILSKYKPTEYNLERYSMIIVPIFRVAVLRTYVVDIYLEQNIQTTDIILHTLKSFNSIHLAEELKPRCLFLFIYVQQSKSLDH